MEKKFKNNMKSRKTCKNEIGITLIALVVTIVVLLILAGVSLSLVLGENGLINKAKEGRDKYAESAKNEQSELNKVDEWLEENIGGNSDENPDEDLGGGTVENVTIPEGYYYVGGTKDTGIVISDAEADNEKYKGQTNVGKDLVGNQWVWVPVETPSSMYVTAAEPIAITGGTTNVVTGVTTSKYTASEIISGQTRVLPNATSSYREPDIVVGDDGTSYDAVQKNWSAAGFTSLKNMAETLVKDYDDMIKSLETYKGFYIGRYELTADGEKPGATLTNTNWYNLYAKCKGLAKNNKVSTRMIYGLQWDATCKWLKEKGFNITDSKDWGNYSNNTEEGHGQKQDTGFSEKWKANNIYDFAGNCWEWTQEAYYTVYRAIRGGYYGVAGSVYPATNRNYYRPDGSGDSSGSSRATLFIM